SRRRHTRFSRDWSSDVCSSDLDHANNITTHIGPAIRAIFPPPADVLLMFLLGGYFLFAVLRMKPWVAAIGAVALAFSSYNMIYVEAGQIGRASCRERV